MKKQCLPCAQVSDSISVKVGFFLPYIALEPITFYLIVFILFCPLDLTVQLHNVRSHNMA